MGKMARDIVTAAILIAFCSLMVIYSPKGFNSDTGFTGFATAENAGALPATANASRDDAVSAIESAESAMREMLEAGFSVIYINDTILAARKALERADYILLLKSHKLSKDMLGRAGELFYGGAAEGITYSDAVAYAEEVEKTKLDAYRIHDLLRAAELKAEDYKNKGVNLENIPGIIGEAKQLFNDELYEEADKKLSEADRLLESSKAQLTFMNAMASAGRSFLKNNWKKLSWGFAVFLALAALLFVRIRKVRARKKLREARIELEVIKRLIKETQKKRFEEGAMSGTSYKIRMDKFNERLTELKHTIPVLEALAQGKRINKKEKNQPK